jgi:hypothetical protein
MEEAIGRISDRVMILERAERHRMNAHSAVVTTKGAERIIQETLGAETAVRVGVTELALNGAGAGIKTAFQRIKRLEETVFADKKSGYVEKPEDPA